MSKFLKNPPETVFDEAARLLYGDLFFGVMLSRELEVSQRIVQRWASGARGVPPFVWPILARLMRQKAEALTGFAGWLEDCIRREDFPQGDRKEPVA